MQLKCIKCGLVDAVRIPSINNSKNYMIYKCPICGNTTTITTKEENSFTKRSYLVDDKTRLLRKTAYNMLLFNMPTFSKGFYVQAAYSCFKNSLKENNDILFESINRSNYKGLQEFIKYLSKEENIKEIKDLWNYKNEKHLDNVFNYCECNKYYRNPRKKNKSRPWYAYDNVCEEIQCDYLDSSLYY